jgi:hypothetical protein
MALPHQRSLVVLPGHAFHNPGFDVRNFILGDFTLKPGGRIAFAIQNAPLTFRVPVIINVAIQGGIVGFLVVEMTDTNQARNAMQGVVNFSNQVSGLRHLSGPVELSVCTITASKNPVNSRAIGISAGAFQNIPAPVD